MRELFENEWFPYAYAIGVSWNDFWEMNPRIIKVLIKGYEKRQKMQDEDMWRMGAYVQYAVSVAVEHCLLGDKAKSKYPEKPLLQKIEQKHGADDYSCLSEEEKKKKTQELFMQLEIMGANFNLNHKGGKA